jgi:DNA repair protein RecO (recombination protein O)
VRTPATLEEVHGIVVSVTDISERDRILSLLTAERGMISVYAAGARQLKNRYMAATQPFCYGKFLLAEQAGRFTIREAELEEIFYELRTDITRAALASYICEVIGYTGTEQPDTELLRLTLNTLYAVSRGLYPLPHIKAAFELRVAALLGFMPDVDACAFCGATEGEFILHIPQGHLICNACRDSLAARAEQDGEGAGQEIALLTDGVRAAIRYVLHAPADRIFSFRLQEDEVHLFSHAAEDYLSWHTDHRFASLQFYKQVID